MGLVHHGEKAHVVSRVIDGETVRIDPRSSPATLVEIVHADADRVEPRCPIAVRCGGCDFMHIAAERQVRAHASIVHDLLSHALRAEMPDVVVHRPVAPLGYRTRARLAFAGDKRGKSASGIAKNGRARSSPSSDASCSTNVSTPRSAFSVRHALEGSSATGEAAIALGARGLPVMDFRFGRDIDAPLPARLDALVREGRIAGARVVLREAAKPLTFGDPRIVQTGADGAPLVVGAGGFAQASDEGAAFLATRVAALVAPAEKRVVELFAGSGTLSILLAAGARALTAVELDKDAASALRANLEARGLHAKVVVADADAYAVGTCDVVVLDPPRMGAKGAATAIARQRPKRVVYVACDPVTLARDGAVLAEAGYVVRALETVELFPQTSHVETIAVFERARKERAAT